MKPPTIKGGLKGRETTPEYSPQSEDEAAGYTSHPEDEDP